MLRPYAPLDLPGLRDVCIRTADGGDDARALYPNPDIVPAVFAEPYVVLEPDLAFVLEDDDGGIAGYVLGTADTEEFVRRYRDVWLPSVADRFPMPAGEPQGRDERMARLLHWPEWMLFPELADLPAHLHIDILPSHQGQGLGRALVTRLVTELSARGVAGLHADVSMGNRGSQHFFERLGFERIDAEGPIRVVHFGLRL